jgi:hypothetical protein
VSRRGVDIYISGKVEAGDEVTTVCSICLIVISTQDQIFFLGDEEYQRAGSYGQIAQEGLCRRREAGRSLMYVAIRGNLTIFPQHDDIQQA